MWTELFLTATCDRKTSHLNRLHYLVSDSQKAGSREALRKEREIQKHESDTGIVQSIKENCPKSHFCIGLFRFLATVVLSYCIWERFPFLYKHGSCLHDLFHFLFLKAELLSGDLIHTSPPLNVKHCGKSIFKQNWSAWMRELSASPAGLGKIQK